MEIDAGTEQQEPLEDQQHESRKANFIVRLSRGDVRLVITYWVFGVLIGNILFRGVNWLIERYYLDIAQSDYGVMPIYAIFWLHIAYILFISIAIWRSANNYAPTHDGDTGWASLAKVSVSIGAIASLFSIAQVLGYWTDPDEQLQAEIDIINSSLPQMMDDATRFDNVVLIGQELKYKYTLVNIDAEGMDVTRFENSISDNIKAMICANTEMVVHLETGKKVLFIYHDNFGKPVTTITVGYDDCVE